MNDTYTNIVLLSPVKVAPGTFRDNTNWGQVRLNKTQGERQKYRKRKRGKQTERETVSIRLLCESDVIYFTLPSTQEMHFYDGIRTNGFSSYIICGGWI